MSRLPEQRNAQPPRWWVRLCQWLWSQRGFIWGTLIVGIVVSVAATWLTSSTSIFTSTPLGTALLWIRDHVLLAGFIGVSLLLLTLLVGAVSRQANISSLPPAPASRQQQNRHAFIHLLRQEYRRQLAESLQGAAMMTLALQARTDVVLSSVSLVSWRMDAPGGGPLPAPTSIVQAYDEAGSGLLILGAPGVGKSTLLRELASELLTRAEQVAAQPVPVIVNLSSWAIKKPLLTTWLVDQLQLVYTIPHRVGQTMIEQDQLLLLLDGLDEMEPSARSDCIGAINAYRAEHFIPIVVCSRSHEYLAQEGRLRVSVAVEVRSLTPEQVDTYLKGAGKPLAAVRTALRGNAALRDLVTTPLMLSVVMLAYRGKTVKDLPQLGSAEDQQQQIFAHYVTRMLEQSTREWRYTPDHTQKWIIWLAQQMKQHQLSEFYLERLQPTWLPTKWAQIAYTALVGLASGLVGLIGGLVFGLVFGLVQGLVLGLQYDEPVFNRFELSLDLVVGLLGGLVIGLVSGLVFGLIRRTQIQPSEKLTWSWISFLQGSVGGLVGGLVGRLVSGLVVVLVGGLVNSLRRKSRTRPSEKLTWSRNPFLRGLVSGGLVVGLVGGLSFGSVDGLGGRLVDGLVDGLVLGLCFVVGSGLVLWLFFVVNGDLVDGLVFVLVVGLVVGLVSGLSDTQVDEHSRLRPNQGILASGWNALLSMLVTGLIGGLVLGLVFGLHGEALTGLADVLVGGLVVGLVRGGLAYLQHYCLRFLLYRNRAMPWRYARFLEEATERILLQRVGGGFRFIHPLFQDYFASLGTPSPPPSEEL